MKFYKLYLILIVIITLLVILKLYFSKREIIIQEPEVVYLTPKPSKVFNFNFEYLINNRCAWESTNKTNLLLVVIVTSYFGNVELRSAMRRAFPSEKLQELNIFRVFLLGVAPNDNQTIQSAIYNENRRFRDIIQGNFEEAYRNLTYKHLMGLNWASRNCPHAKFIAKMDDDIVVDYRKAVALLRNATWPQKLLAGFVFKRLAVKRDPANKWYVTQKEFQGSHYPTYVSGWFYVTNPQTAARLVAMSAYEPYFWIDDVYITGMLALVLRIKFYNLNKYFTTHPEVLQCCINDVERLGLDCDVLVGPNGGDNNLFFNFNEALSKCARSGCEKRLRSINETCIVEKKYALGNGSGAVETYKLV